MTTPDAVLAYEKLIKRLAQSSSAAIAYSAAILATMALAPGMNLPPEVAGLAGGVGVKILSDILGKMAAGQEVSNKDLFRELEKANADLERALKRDDYLRTYARLLNKFRENHREHQVLLQKIDHILKAIGPDIELTPEQETYYLNKYLEEVTRTTKRLPWGYALSAISPDLEISEIYVSPTLIQQERQRAVQIIQDEKEERDQERREKKINAQDTSTPRPVLADIYELLTFRTPVSIVGYMGTGKSLTANYITWLLAKKDGLKSMGFTHSKTPILIRLGDQAVVESAALSISIFDLATRHFAPPDKLAVMQVLKKEWRNGNILLILDALDEFSGNLDEIKSEIEYLVESTAEENNIFLTSRPSTYRLAQPAGFKTFELSEIEPHTLNRYIRKWVSALLPASDKRDTDLEGHIEFLNEQIAGHSLVEDMVSNPLLLTILVALSLTREGIDLSQVQNETDLYQQYINYIIGREKLKPSFVRPQNLSDLMLQVVYGYAGLLVQIARSKPTPQFPDNKYLVEKISETQYFSKSPADVALIETCLEFWKRAGLLVERDDTSLRISFRHEAFQFFGAALGLKYLPAPIREQMLDTVGNSPQWFDVLRLYLGLKPDFDFPWG